MSPSTPDKTLRLYAIVRKDIGMDPGKLASQAGHAYVGCLLQALKQGKAFAGEYCNTHSDAPATKVCLKGSLSQLVAAQEAADKAGLPSFMVLDSGCANFFNGEPTITSLGIGPATSDQLPSIVRKLPLL